MLNPIVSTSWLNENLEDPDLIVLYALLKGDKSELEVPLIPGTRCFDIKNAFSDTESEFPNTVPSPEQFEREARKLGINKNSKIVVYDHKGIYEAPRVWWLFKTMGHEQIVVLDGGLPAWKQEGFEVDTYALSTADEGDFIANYDSGNVCSIADTNKALSMDNMQVLDARSLGRFSGTAPEPREGLSSGHMPGSVSLPYTEVLDDGKFRPVAELKAIFESKKIANQNLIFSCGSGITACIILLAAEIALGNESAVFDGSWTEWAMTEGMEIVKE